MVRSDPAAPCALGGRLLRSRPPPAHARSGLIKLHCARGDTASGCALIEEMVGASVAPKLRSFSPIIMGAALGILVPHVVHEINEEQKTMERSRKRARRHHPILKMSHRGVP